MPIDAIRWSVKDLGISEAQRHFPASGKRQDGTHLPVPLVSVQKFGLEIVSCVNTGDKSMACANLRGAVLL